MDRPEVSLDRMRSFVRVAERGNLSAVARELGLGQSTVTRHIRELEQAVGVPLLTRTTRRVTMTDEGRRYYADCVQILRLVEHAGEEARSTRGAPAGTVRASCTAAFGVLHVSRFVFAFQDRYPDVSVDLSLTDERIDLVREGVDVAIRLGPLTDSSMKLKPLGRSRRVLVASPDYLAIRGRRARKISPNTRPWGCPTSPAATCWCCTDAAAAAMRCLCPGDCVSTTGLPHERRSLPVAASRRPISGWSGTFLRPADSNACFRTIRRLPFH